MGKRLPYTPNGQIRSALRALWLRSRERSAALKRDQNTCQRCGRKKSVAKGRECKVEVHHLGGVLNWDKLIGAIREYLLCDPDKLETICVDCHRREHGKKG